MQELTVLSAIAVAALLVAVWRRRTVTVGLLLIVVYYYIAGNMELMLTIVEGQLPSSLFFTTEEDVVYATLLLNAGLVAMITGMAAGERLMRPVPPRDPDEADPLFRACSGHHAIAAYALLSVIASGFEFLAAGPLSALTQLLLPLMSLRLFPLFVSAYRYFMFGREGAIFFLLVALEIVLNLSYFASFMKAFIVVGCALGLAQMNGRTLRPLPTLLACAFIIAIVGGWTAVKGDYRMYLSEGRTSQEDTKSLPEKVSFLTDQIGAMTWTDMQDGLYRALLRIGYSGFFAATTANVPSHMAHTEGSHLLSSIQRALVPRAINPDKPVIDDSEITQFYTGLAVAGTEEGTSINIGQFGELYADLGISGMLIALAVIGFLFTECQRLIFRHAGPGLDGNGIVACLIVSFAAAFYSLPKFTASFLYTAFSAYLFLRLGYPWFERQGRRIAAMRAVRRARFA
jgi:hypothetical protein